jgi:hypothetical protein
MGVERKLVKRLNQHFEEEGPECFKTLRVALPVTQTKIDWNINIANLFKQLAGQKK